MKTRKATIAKTKHKSNPFTVTIEGRADKKITLRYTTQWRAAIGAVRAERDFLAKHPIVNSLRITYPDGSYRHAWIDPFFRKPVLGNFRNAPKTKKKK